MNATVWEMQIDLVEIHVSFNKIDEINGRRNYHLKELNKSMDEKNSKYADRDI